MIKNVFQKMYSSMIKNESMRTSDITSDITSDNDHDNNKNKHRVRVQITSLRWLSVLFNSLFNITSNETWCFSYQSIIDIKNQKVFFKASKVYTVLNDKEYKRQTQSSQLYKLG